jgi:hypothetical protein
LINLPNEIVKPKDHWVVQWRHLPDRCRHVPSFLQKLWRQLVLVCSGVGRKVGPRQAVGREIARVPPSEQPVGAVIHPHATFGRTE